MNNISENFNIKKCCGCGACVNGCPVDAIEYDEDKKGFIIPKVDNDKCINCGKCKKICPFINEIKKEESLQAYAGVNKLNDERLDSSSGGIFSVLARYVLNANGIVFGCTMDENFQVYHTPISDPLELCKIRGSKYIQSHIKYTYREVKRELEKGVFVLFSGTPCQIAGLNLYLENKFNNKLITVEVVCHGVPSQKLFDDYRTLLEKKHNTKLKKYKFRIKKTINNGMNCFVGYQFRDDKKYRIKNWPQDSYYYYYMNSCINRESCYECLFATKERVSDFTLCDYWGWENYHHEFPKNTTLSGILVNTEKGQKILNEIKEDLIMNETNICDIIKQNRCLRFPTTKGKEDILNLWEQEGYERVDKKFRKENRRNIMKYKLMSFFPRSIILKFHHILRREK